MGGFLLIRKDGVAPLSGYRPDAALRVFAKRGLQEACRLQRPEFDLVLFHKRLSSERHWLDFGGGDFIANAGTLIYRQKTGSVALAALHEDFRAGLDVDKGLLGNYCVVLQRQGELTLFCDRSGFMRIYHDPDFRVFSNSFLAVAHALPALSVSPMELYEYVFYGFFFKTNTLFEQVRILDHNHLWHPGPRLRNTPRAVHFEDFPAGAGFEAMLDAVRENLLDYVATLGSASGRSITCALSGGYDTRLLLALLRRLNLPVHLYVYGSERSDDVRVAKEVTRGEGLALDHIDRDAWPRIPVEDWADHVEKEFYFFDGIKALGIFDNGSDLQTRLDRARRARLHLNGAGGEIYREIWNLPDRPVSISNFLGNTYDFGRYDFCTEVFQKGEFFARLAGKVREILGIDGDRLSRTEVEMLFPSLRNLFAATTVLANNQIGDAVLPYVEPRLVYQSYRIPLRYKFQGQFQAELIRSLSPALARYSSAYGFNFSDSVPLRARIESRLKRYLPVALRVLIRSRRPKDTSRPDSLRGQYYSAVFGGRDLAIRKYLNPDALGDPEKLLRALTAEVVIGDYFRESH